MTTVEVARIAVVLGAGGWVGHAFHAAVLDALSDELGWDAGGADLLVGTSAGSIVAALLRAGMPAADLARRARGEALSPAGAQVVARAGFGAPRPRPPRQRSFGAMASPARLRLALQMPWTARPGTVMAAMLPAGRIPTDTLGTPFAALYGAQWPSRPTWIVAVDLDTGRRTVFGRPGSPEATPAEAVQASCAIPAYFEPAKIGAARYVDGGVHSTTNADLVGAERPTLVIVSAPMSAVRGAARIGLELPIRQIARRSLAREVAGLRRLGIEVVTFQPTADDLELMNGDALDPAKLGPVSARVGETVRRRLARADVRTRLAALSPR
jgi:NTE family protein